LAPQKDWDVNQGTADVISVLEGIKAKTSANVSLADLIVLGGCAAVEKASGKSVPFTHVLEPKFDGFRNYKNTNDPRSTEALLVDKAQLLGLTAPEMTVLVAGLRTLGANHGGSTHGVMTENVGTLTNEGLVNLLDMNTVWSATDSSSELFEGKCRKTGAVKYTGTRADLVFGSNSILRALAEVYAEAGSEEKFKTDFIKAWNKVMNADRFDIA